MLRLEDRLRELAQGSEGDAGFSPRLFDASREEGRAALDALLAGGEVACARDLLLEQLGELLSARAPGEKLAGAALEARVRAHLGDTPPWAYGTWVYYPWHRRLVHVLPEPEYRELRSSRNGYKITPEEQARLARARIGVVGLSVGQAGAITLVLEGIGGEFRLADHDALSLSNLNRLRAPVHELGVNKCTIAARRMVEIDPYLRIRVLDGGLTEDNVGAFLDGGGPLDLVLEECDDLFAKILVRDHARRRGIPVVMETNDRGMLDVERFDREPDRPLLHGLLGDVRPEQLKGLAVRDKVPYVLRILGEDLSPRLIGSLFEVDESLSSWPQLASGVALGSALLTHAARRILLGQCSRSGRFWVDLDALVVDETAALSSPVAPGGEDGEGAPPPSAPLPPLVRSGPSISKEDVRRIVAYGTLAPSGGNAQPWRFSYRAPRLRCSLDPARSATLLDYARLASHVALGAAVENMDLAARAMGLVAAVHPPPGGASELVACELWLSERGDVGPHDRPPLAVERAPGEPELVRQIARRVTNRKLGPRAELPEEARQRLAAAAASAGARLQIVSDERRLGELGEVIAEAERLRMLSPALHAEMMGELRWSRREVAATRDGLDVRTLELSAADLAGLRLITKRPAMEFLASLGKGRALSRLTRKALQGASALGLLTIDGQGADRYFLGGRAAQRVWLTASALGLAIQPMTASLYLFARLERGGAEGLAPHEAAMLRALRQRYLAVVDVAPDDAEILLFRIAQAGEPTARSLRRRVEDVLVFEEDED